MSVTLEQAQLLSIYHNLPHSLVLETANQFRYEGVRRRNCLHNTGVELYAFNRLQRGYLPEEFRPPEGTFGAKQS